MDSNPRATVLLSVDYGDKRKFLGQSVDLQTERIASLISFQVANVAKIGHDTRSTIILLTL